MHYFCRGEWGTIIMELILCLPRNNEIGFQPSTNTAIEEKIELDNDEQKEATHLKEVKRLGKKRRTISNIDRHVEVDVEF